MAQTRIYPLDPEPLKPSETLLAAMVARTRRHPGWGLALALGLTVAAAYLDRRLGTRGSAECLFLLPIALGGALLSGPFPALVTGVCVVSELWIAVSRPAPQGLSAAGWAAEAAFVLTAALMLSLTMALRRAITREGRQSRVLDGMRAVSAAIVSSLDLERVLDTALAQAQRLTRGDPVAIWLLDPEGAHLALAATQARSRNRRVRADASAVTLSSSHMLAECIRMRAAIVAGSRGADGEPATGFCLMGVDQAAAIPLVTHGLVVGVLAAGFDARPDADALLVLRELANDSAVAIDNARLYSQSQRQVVALEEMRAQAETRERQARFLAEAGTLFTQSLDVRATMDAVVTRASEMLGDACLILVTYPGESVLRVAASFEGQPAIGRSLREYLGDHPARFGVGVLGRVAAEGIARVARGDPGNPGELGECASAVGVRGVLAAPLWARGQVRGVLAAAYYDVERLPTDEDLRLAVLLADRAAAAIENAALFEETQQARVTLEAWGQELEQRVAAKTQELRDAQRDLLRSERLASIGQLAATVAHELRNPLNVIKVAHFALARGCSAERAARHLEAIARQVSAASRIITDLLDFARESPPQFAPLDLNRLVQQVVADTVTPENLTVLMELDPTIHEVEADRMQIAQVLCNIVENAVQMMPAGGDLSIRSFEDGGRVCLSVRDTGPGIPEHVRPRIFEPLYTTRTKGTGLGLAVARRIVEAHRGEILAESLPGAGATFTVALPSCQGAPAASG